MLFSGCGSKDSANQSGHLAGFEVEQYALNKVEASTDTTKSTIHPGDIEDELTLIPNNKLTPRAKEGLNALEERLVSAGVPILSVSTRVAHKMDADALKERENIKGNDELPVVVARIPEDFLKTNRFSVIQIERQALALVTDGAPMRYLSIVGVDSTTGKEKTCDMGLIYDRGFASEWTQPAGLEYAQAEEATKAAVSAACDKEKLILDDFIFSEDNIGRIVEIHATFANDVTNPGVFMDLLERSFLNLNKESKAKISLFYIYINNDKGEIVTESAYSLASGSNTYWFAPKYGDDEDSREMLPDFLKG